MTVGKNRGILVFWLAVSFILWNSNLRTFTARNLILMNINRKGCMRSQQKSRRKTEKMKGEYLETPHFRDIGFLDFVHRPDFS
jgi:hypothetical protein